MKLRRFVAPDLQTALRRVREEQGLDAVIISSNRIHAGVEIIAAVHYDATRIAEALRTLRRSGEID